MEKIGKYRWTICTLIFFATTINYLDRAVTSLLKSDLTKEFNWTETDYSNLVIAFQVSYAIGMLGVGRFIDKVGTKMGYALSLIAWSIADLHLDFLLPVQHLELQKQEIFRLQLKQLQNGSLKKKEHLLPASLTQGLM